MDSDSESAHSEPQEQMALNRSIKRSASPLFYSDDGAVDTTGDSSDKRTKTEHTASQANTTPQEDGLTADGMIPGYNASEQESRPRLAIYHPSFKAAEKLVTNVCDHFRDEVKQLRDEGYSNAEIDIIEDGSLKKCQRPSESYPSIGAVGCLGPSGVGKSSFLNSMLNQKKAAPEHDSDRGTYVVHEYMRPQYKQIARYEVHVPYLRIGQIRKLVKKHYENILAYLERRDDLDDGEEDELQVKYETALDFFCALLCDLPDFESTEDAESYFEAKRSEEDEDVISELMDNIEDLLKKRKLDDGIEVFTAETETELGDIFKQVSRPSKGKGGKARQPSPWPLITKVQVRQNNDLLNAGVVLADTAGVTDTNLTVVDNTLRYIKSAGTVLVFSGHKRIEKEPLVDQHLRQCIQMGKMNNTALVVTMIDTKQVYRDTEKDELPDAEKAVLEKAEGRVANLRSEENKLNRAKRGASDKDFRAIQDRLEDLEVEKALAANAVKQVAVQIRCRDIREKMKGRLRKLEKSDNAPELPIYFVSSVAYQQHIDGYDPKQPPTLDLQGTGIPALRHMLYDIPARGKINTLSRICKSRLPNIFGGILGILTKSKLERKAEVEKLVRKVLERYSTLVDDVVKEVKEQFKERILKTIKDNEQKWKDKAERLLTGWAKMKSVTFTAFCRRSGHWKVPGTTKENVSWNAFIQNIFDTKLVAVFDLFHEDMDNTESAAVTNLTQLFKSLEEQLQACDDFQGVDMEPFFAFMRSAREDVLNQTSTLFESLTADINEIRHSATLDTKKSYVGLAMQPTYQECLLMQAANYETTQRNRRVHKKIKPHDLRVDCVREKLTGNVEQISVFASVGSMASGALDKKLSLWDEKFRGAVGRGCRSILEDFNRRYTVSEVKSEEDPESAKRLQDAAKKAIDIIEGPMKEHIELCEAYERSG